MSRGLDQKMSNRPFLNNNPNATPEDKVKMAILISTPQIFSIEKGSNHSNDVLKIIKSTFKNTRRHLPRSILNGNENIRSSIYTCLDLIPNDARTQGYNPDYYNKYLKYKNKYLALRKNFSN
jgi:hypothetical protein